MDSEVKKSCLTDISHSIFDLDEKVTSIKISNSWGISLNESCKILEEWLENNKDKNDKICKEFIIRGIDKNGTAFISVVPEKRLQIAQSKLSKSCHFLYSLEKVSESNSININVVCDCNVINIKLNTNIRDQKDNFSEKSSAFKIAQDDKIENERKIKENDITSRVELSKSSESSGPEKNNKSPKTNVNTSKITNAKPNPFASFFAPKSKVTPKQEIASPVEISVKKEHVEPEITDKKPNIQHNEKNNERKTKNRDEEMKLKTQKRNLSIVDDDDDDDDDIPRTPQDRPIRPKNKRAKKSIESSEKRSRIIKMEESSDEEMGEVKEHINISENIKNNTGHSSPKTKDNEQLESTTSQSKRRQAKRTVTKTYEDEDGYFTTVKEIEEYSCSDDEPELIDNSIKNEILNDKESNNIKGNLKKSTKPVGSGTTKPQTSPKGKTKSKSKTISKQGSITSFFSKK